MTQNDIINVLKKSKNWLNREQLEQVLNKNNINKSLYSLRKFKIVDYKLIKIGKYYNFLYKYKEGKKMSVINNESLENAILDVEKVLEPHNEVEKELIIQQLIVKRQSAKRKQLMQDNVSSINLKDLIRNIGKAQND